MMGKLLDSVLRHRMAVLILAGLLGCGGLYAFQSLPVDAFPDECLAPVAGVAHGPTR